MHSRFQAQGQPRQPNFGQELECPTKTSNLQQDVSAWQPSICTLTPRHCDDRQRFSSTSPPRYPALQRIVAIHSRYCKANMSAFPTRAFSGHMRQPSMSAASGSSGQSHALIARVNEKKAELENLKELRDLSAAMASQMEVLEQKLATLSDGTEAIALVLANWHNVLRAINMASGMASFQSRRLIMSGALSQQQRTCRNQLRMGVRQTKTRPFPCHKHSSASQQNTPRTYRRTRKQRQRKRTSNRRAGQDALPGYTCFCSRGK